METIFQRDSFFVCLSCKRLMDADIGDYGNDKHNDEIEHDCGECGTPFTVRYVGGDEFLVKFDL